MTGEQIARLLPYGEKGEVLKSFKPREDRARTFPGSYQKIMDMLQRMVEGKEVSRFRDHEGQAYVHMLTNPNMKPPGNWYNRQHELACADVFVSLYLTGKLDHWDYKWTKQELEYYDVKKLKVYYDRRFVLDGKVFFLEVDRGTEDSEQLEDKVRKYVEFTNRFPDEHFFVLFSVEGSRYYNLTDRINWMLKTLLKDTPGFQFLVTEHKVFCANPLSACFGSPNHTPLLQLLELWAETPA